MPTGSRSTKSKSKTKKASRTSSKRIVASGRGSRLTSRPLAVIAAVLFGSVGIYLLAASGALQPEEVAVADEPARGLLYEGKKIKAKGPCAGGFDLTSSEDETENKARGQSARRCGHLDPAPPGIDIRERIKTVDSNLAALADEDVKRKPIKSEDTSNASQVITAETVNRYNMNGLAARDWPCVGDGSNEARIELIYVYPAGGTNRLSDIRGGLNGIARRTNQIFFASGHESGNGHQIRFATNNGNADCNLKISAEGIRGSELDNYSFIRARLVERGYKGVPVTYTDATSGVKLTVYEDRKYLVWIDKDIASKCGLGEMRSDDSRADTNSNNHSVTFSYIWKGCWNYAEPHEIGHMLGAVQTSAPHATAGHHCFDERDVMCYDDDGAGGVSMRSICGQAIDWWRLDCRHDDYYRGADPADGYLSRHWNIANNRFLTR